MERVNWQATLRPARLQRWLPTIVLAGVGIYLWILAGYIAFVYVNDPIVINESIDSSHYFTRRAIFIGGIALLFTVAAIGMLPIGSDSRHYQDFLPVSADGRRNLKRSLGCSCMAVVVLVIVALACVVPVVWGLRTHWRTGISSTSPDGRFEATWLENVPFGVVRGSGSPSRSGVILRDRTQKRRFFPWPRDDRITVYYYDEEAGELYWDDVSKIHVEPLGGLGAARNPIVDSWRGVQVVVGSTLD